MASNREEGRAIAPAQAVTPAKPQPRTGLRLFGCVLGLGAVAVKWPWLGLLLGIGLILWGAQSWQTSKASFVPWVLQKAGTKLLHATTIVTGLGLFVFSLASLAIHQGNDDREARKQEEALQVAAAEAKVADRQRRQHELPSKLPGWSAAAKQALAAVESTQVASAAVRAQLAAVTAESAGYTEALASMGGSDAKQLRKDMSEASAKLGKREALEQALVSLDSADRKAQELSTRKEWALADGAYGSALEAVATLEQREPWLNQFVPPELNVSTVKAGLERRRKGIAPQVAAAAAEVAHNETLAKLASATDSLNISDKGSYEQARVILTDELAKCPRCKAKGAIVKSLRDIDTELSNWPIRVSGLHEMKIRYADLKGRRVELRGKLKPSTYYNCRFASSSAWRSFELESGGDDIHVYCSRGDEGCETIFQRHASGGASRGTAVLEYPASNSVCEEDQAVLSIWAN